jgi:membrane associated rhomboid family serine protease
MAGFLDDLKYSIRTGGALTQIILVNTIVFLIANIIVYGFGFKADNWADYIALPGRFKEFLYRPWTLFTYMFFHLDLSHVFWNMVWLYSLGRIFNELIGPKRLLWVYLLGGISGGLLFLIIYSTVNVGGLLLGASAGVMAIVVAVAAFAPNYVVQLFIFGPVRLKYIALISFIITSVLYFQSNTGGKVAHIGGALFGLVYGLQYKRGRDMARGLGNMGSSIGGMFDKKKKSPLKVTYNKRKVSDEEYNASKVVEQQVIDAILDKISRSGYDSLSKREKEILFKASNKKDKR